MSYSTANSAWRSLYDGLSNFFSKKLSTEALNPKISKVKDNGCISFTTFLQ